MEEVHAGAEPTKDGGVGCFLTNYRGFVRFLWKEIHMILILFSTSENLNP